MTDVPIKPGETLYIRPVPPNTVTVWRPKGGGYAKVTSSGIYVPDPVEPPPVEPPPATGVVRRCPASYSVDQFIAMMRDMTLDVIELEAGVRHWPLGFVKDLSRKSRPLTVRPVPGADVSWDGTGSSGWLHFNTLNGPGTPSIPVEDISFQGPFTLRNYALGSTGLVMTGWVNRFGLHDFIVRNVTGTGNLSHALYVNSDESHRASALSANRWDVQSNRSISALQTYHEPQIDGLTAVGWKVSGVNRAAYIYHNAKAVVLDGWTIIDSNVTIDAEGVPTGVVKNCVSMNSGPIAKGQGYWLAAGVVDGGGNRVA